MILLALLVVGLLVALAGIITAMAPRSGRRLRPGRFLAALVRKHRAVKTEHLVHEPDGDFCLHEVCECGAARPCGHRERWSSRLCLR